MVTPFCENGNVLEFLRAKKLEIKQILYIVRFHFDCFNLRLLSILISQIHGVSCGLQYLHSKGIVHGDLRAVNFWIHFKLLILIGA